MRYEQLLCGFKRSAKSQKVTSPCGWMDSLVKSKKWMRTMGFFKRGDPFGGSNFSCKFVWSNLSDLPEKNRAWSLGLVTFYQPPRTPGCNRGKMKVYFWIPGYLERNVSFMSSWRWPQGMINCPKNLRCVYIILCIYIYTYVSKLYEFDITYKPLKSTFRTKIIPSWELT